MQNGLHGCRLKLSASPTLLAHSEVSYPEAHSGSFPEPEPCWQRPVVWRHFCRPTGPRGSLGCLTARLGGTTTHTNTHTHTGQGGVAHKNHDMDESRSVMTQNMLICKKKIIIKKRTLADPLGCGEGAGDASTRRANQGKQNTKQAELTQEQR